MGRNNRQKLQHSSARSARRVALAVAVLAAGALVFTGCSMAGSAADRARVVSAPAAIASTAPSAAPSAEPTPVVSHSKVDVTVTVAFERKSVDDAAADKGTSRVSTAGVDGAKVQTFDVTLVDGVETSRALVREAQTVAPVAEVTSVGTRVAAPAVAPAPKAAPAPEPAAPDAGSGCDPNYSGACVPIASDVDCAGGSGNGPAYVRGPVRVVGSDIYGLDRDGDGVGCE